MLFRAGDEDTICAISTPPGAGGIAVIRVSGNRALELTRKSCSFLPENPESHRVFYGHLKSDGETVDEVLVTYFQDGRSFTGEETLEVACHGGRVVTASVLKTLVTDGCRLATKGEFTYRAFMNGRLDLVQAESVLSLIESRSQQSAKLALRQLQGRLSSDFNSIENELLWLLAHLEASIDFSTEDIPTVADEELLRRCGLVKEKVQKLEASYGQGRVLRDGLQVALLGEPNVGKSSLLNAFLREERAIVTPHAGTTRDTIEGQISVGGLPITFVDTAGLRTTENEIEKMGIERSRKAMDAADLIFFVLDVTKPGPPDLTEFLTAHLSKTKVLLNKMDLLPIGTSEKRVAEICSILKIEQVFPISAATSEGLDILESMLAERVKEIDSESSNVVTQARHLEHLQKIHSCLDSAIRLIKGSESPEFIAFELNDAIRSVHELLGKEFNEQIIDRIFKEFCLGK